MASIDKREDGWRVRWRDPDGQARARQCPNKASAQRLQAEVEAAIAEGRRWEPRDLRPEPDLRDLRKDYAEECSRCLKPNTAIRYARALDIFLRFLERKYGANAQLPPSLLTRRLLSDFHADLDHTGLHGQLRTGATKRKIVEVIQLGWQWLYDEDDSGANIPMPRKLRMRREPAAMTVAPTWAEMDACIDALVSWQRDLAIVLRFTGLRVQQVMGLTWKDIDLEHARLTVRGELGKSKQEQRGRIIPVSRHLIQHLHEFRRNDQEWIIVSNRTRGGDRERAARARDFALGWERAGVRKEAWEQRPHHSMRKGFVSELKRSGADPDAVEFLVGHSLGLRGVYIDPEAMPLRETIDLIPPLGGKSLKRRTAAREEKTRSPSSDEPRFDGGDPNDPRPYREITLDGTRWFDRNGQPLDGKNITGLRENDALPSNVRPFPTGGRQNDIALGKKRPDPMCPPGVRNEKAPGKSFDLPGAYIADGGGAGS